MGSPHRYSHRRQPGPPVIWYARAGASVNDAPLGPKTAARTKAIRRVFLKNCHGRATITEVGNIACDLGLLEDFSTHRSAYEAVMVALRPISTHNLWESIHRPAPVQAQSPPG